MTTISKTRLLLAPESFDNAGLDRDAEAMHAAIADLVRIYQFRDRDQICCHDISVTQCYALETLVNHGPLRLGALAGRLFLDKSTTSRVVAALMRKGYVAQTEDPKDRRAVELHATRDGRRLCARIHADLIAQQRHLLEELEPEIRAGVVHVLQRLASAADARFRTGGASANSSCCAPGSEARECP